MTTDGMVLVIDDDPAMRDSLSTLLRSAGVAVRTFSSAEEFLANERSAGSSCLICEVQLPGQSGLELQRRLVDAGDLIPVIFIAARGDIAMAVRAMKDGAVEFLPKPFAERDLLDAVRVALARDVTRRAKQAAHDQIQARWSTLSPRERDVATRILNGQTNRFVAAELGLSEITVKIHRRNALRKMQVTSLLGLAQVLGRVQPPYSARIDGR
jgi:FixJ family two-component response regulator